MTQIDALQFAITKHKGQFRKSGHSYLSHCKHVFERIKEVGLDRDYQHAALLHDVMECTQTSSRELKKVFGEKVSRMVSLLSKKPKEDFSNDTLGYNKRVTDYIRKLKRGVKQYPGIIPIKIADQLDNLRDISYFSEQKYYRIIWTIHFYYLPFYASLSEKIPVTFRDSFDLLYSELEETLMRLLSGSYVKNGSVRVEDFLST